MQVFGREQVFSLVESSSATRSLLLAVMPFNYQNVLYICINKKYDGLVNWRTDMILSIGKEWKAGKVSYPEQEASKKK